MYVLDSVFTVSALTFYRSQTLFFPQFWAFSCRSAFCCAHFLPAALACAAHRFFPVSTRSLLAWQRINSSAVRWQAVQVIHQDYSWKKSNTGFCLKQLLLHHFNLLWSPGLQMKFLEDTAFSECKESRWAVAASRASPSAYEQPSVTVEKHLVEWLNEMWKCLRLRPHVVSDTLQVTNPDYILKEFLSNVESLQCHFLRR